MTPLDAVRRRVRSAPPRRDALLALPAAAEALEASLGLRFGGEAAVGLHTGSETAVTVAYEALRKLVELPTAGDARIIRREWDADGQQWIVLTASRLEGVVAALHTADAVVTDEGFGSQLRRSVFCFADALRVCHLVYLHGRGTFYPFAPGSGRRRDVGLERRVRAVVEGAVPVEARRSLCSPLWTLPLT